MKMEPGIQFGATYNGQPIMSVENLRAALDNITDGRIRVPVDKAAEIEMVGEGVFIGTVSNKLAEKGGDWKCDRLTISVDLP